MSADAFRAMLRFVYYGDANIPPLAACELIAFCRMFGMGDLHRLCESIIKANVNGATVVDVLGVTYLKHMSEREEAQALRKSAMAYLINNLTSVDLSSLRKMDPHIALDVLFAAQAHEKSSPSGAKDWVKPSATAIAVPSTQTPAAAAAGGAFAGRVT